MIMIASSWLRLVTDNPIVRISGTRSLLRLQLPLIILVLLGSAKL